MATTIDYGSDYGAEANDYKFCPIIISGYLAASIKPNAGPELAGAIKGRGPRCSWWDAGKNRCAVLSLARNK